MHKENDYDIWKLIFFTLGFLRLWKFSVDKLCVAPAFDGWYRAVTLDYYQEEDEVMVRYVDYGGYGRLPRSDLRQIRLVS